MTDGFNKNLINKFLSGFNVKSGDSDAEKKKSLKDIESKHLQEYLAGSLSGDKAFGDIPGLELEKAIQPPVADKTSMYNRDEILHKDDPKYREKDPYQEALMELFYLFNQDSLQHISMFPTGTIDTEGKKFNSLEEAAEYILKKRGGKYTSQDVNNLARELLFLNVSGNENIVDEIVDNALKNINSGEIKIVKEDKYSYFTNLIQQCGFELNQDNAYIYQTIYTILDELQKDGRRDSINLWKNLQTTFEDCAKIKNPEALKQRLLTEHGINIYPIEEQEKATHIQLQSFVAGLLSGVYGYLSNAENSLHNSGSLFYDICNIGNEEIDKLANLLGKDTVTMREDIEHLRKMQDIWKGSGIESTSLDEFKEVFKIMFGKEYDEDLAQELMNYCTRNPNLDIFKDTEFCYKLEKLCGIDIVTSRKFNLKIQQVCSGLGDILFMIWGMKMIGGTSIMKSFGTSSAAYFNSIGLSGKALELAASMPVGSATFASYTLFKEGLDNIITGNALNGEKWEESAGQIWESAKFGAYATALNVLLISPVIASQVGRGLKAAEKLVDSQGVVSGEEYMKAFYEAQEEIIKSPLGKFAYSTAVNTLGFTAYGIASDLIENGTDPLKNGNAWKYIGDVTLANLENMLTFEGLQLLIGGVIAGQIGAESVREMTVEEISNFEFLKDITIEKYQPKEGEIVTSENAGEQAYLVRLPNNVTLIANSSREAISLGATIMFKEIELRNAAVSMTADNIQSSRTTDFDDIVTEDIDGTTAPIEINNQSTVNIYTLKNNPDAKLKEYSYKYKGQTFKFMTAECIDTYKLQILIKLDLNRRLLSGKVPVFAKLSDNTQKRFTCLLIDNANQYHRLLALLISVQNEEKLLNIINNRDLLNKKLADIQELETYFKLHEFTQLGGLLDIKEVDPVKYERIASSGIFDLVKEGKLDARSLGQLGIHSDLSPDIYSDLALLKSNKSIVPEFAKGTDLKTAFEQTKLGDAVEVGGKMYLNDGNGLIEWNMTKEKYLELFPPVQRFATTQGALGDCYLVQALGLSMHNPKARVEFLQSFSLKGNDVIVTVKGLEDYYGNWTFDNSIIILPKNNKHLCGCKGMQMYEQAYARVALRENTTVDYPSIAPIDEVVQRIESGYPAQVLADIYGKGHLVDIWLSKYEKSDHTIHQSTSYTGLNYITMPYKKDGNTISINLNKQQDNRTKIHVFDKFFIDYPDKSLALTGLDISTTEILLAHTANNHDYLVSFGTMRKANEASESPLLSEYNIVSMHAYSILGYDESTKMVKIGNPHAYGEVTEIPLETLHQYIYLLDFLKL